MIAQNSKRQWQGQRQPQTQNISPAPLLQSIKPSLDAFSKPMREKSTPPAATHWQNTTQQSSISPKKDKINGQNVASTSHATNVNRMRQILHYRQQMEQQRQNLSMLKVEGSRNVFGVQEAGKQGMMVHSQVTDKRRSVGQRQTTVTGSGNEGVSINAGNRLKGSGMGGRGKGEESNHKSKIKVTIDSPHLNSLQGGQNRGEKSAPNITDITSQGLLRGPGSRRDSKFLTATGKDTAMMEVVGQDGQADLLMDLGILTPTTLAEQTSRGVGIRKSKEGALGAKLPNDFGFKKGSVKGIDEILKSGQKVHSEHHVTEEIPVNEQSIMQQVAGTMQAVDQKLDAVDGGVKKSAKFEDIRGSNASKSLTNDINQALQYSSYNPDQSIMKGSDFRHQGSTQSQPDSLVSRAKNNRSTVTRTKADTMLSKIVEVQGQLQHGSRRSRKRPGTKCEDALSSLLTNDQSSGIQQLDKKLIRQLHEQQMMYRMQKQYLENQNVGNVVVVNGQDCQLMKMPENQEELLLYQYIQEMQRLVPETIRSQDQGEITGSFISRDRQGDIAPFSADSLDYNSTKDFKFVNQQSILGDEMPSVNDSQVAQKLMQGKGEEQQDSLVNSGQLQVQQPNLGKEAGKRMGKSQFGLETDLLNGANPGHRESGANAIKSQKDIPTKSNNQQKGALRQGKSHEQDILMVQGRASRASRAGSSTSDYKLRQNTSQVQQKPQTADQQTGGGRMMQRRFRNQKGGVYEGSNASKGSIQRQTFQKQLQQIRSNKVWSNTIGKTLLVNQQQRNLANITQQESSTATTQLGSFSLSKMYPGASTGKIRLAANQRLNQRSEKNKSLQVSGVLGQQLSQKQGHEFPQTIADTQIFSQQMNQLRYDQPTIYNRSMLEQNLKNLSMSEDGESMLTDAAMAQVQQIDALDLPADEVFGPSFKKSFLFLEKYDAKDIKQRIYNRDGSLKENSKPFFIEQQEKEKKIRANRTQHLRLGGKVDGKKDNCRPLQGNYIHSRMYTSQRHYEKCKDRLMTYFTHQLIHQKRAANSQLAKRNRQRPEQIFSQNKETIMTVHAQQGKLGQSTTGNGKSENNKDHRPSILQTKRTAWAGASSDGDFGIQTGESQQQIRKAVMQPSMARLQSNEIDQALSKGNIMVRAEGYKVMSDGVAADPGSITNDQNVDHSNIDPNSAMLNSANVKIVQRMYSDTDNNSPIPEVKPEDIMSSSKKYRKSNVKEFKEYVGKAASQPPKKRHGQSQTHQRSLLGESNLGTSTISGDKNQPGNVHDSAEFKSRNCLDASPTNSQPHKNKAKARLVAAVTSETIVVDHNDRSELNSGPKQRNVQKSNDSQGMVSEHVSTQWLTSQNRVFEDFIAQTNNSTAQQYMPIHSMIQKLNGSMIPYNLESHGLKTPAEILLYNKQQQYKASQFTSTRNLAGGSEPTTYPPSAILTPPSMVPMLTTPQPPFAQFQLLAVPSENAKPLWVVRTGSKRSSVVNYKTEAGQHLTKLSQGDPFKQFRLIEEHGHQKLHLLEEKLEGEMRKNSGGPNGNNRNALEQRKKSIFTKEFRLNNGDINDIVSRVPSGKSRSTTEVRMLGKQSERSRSPGDKKVSYGIEHLKVGINPRYLQSQREAMKKKGSKKKDTKPFDNFNLNKRFHSEIEFEEFTQSQKDGLLEQLQYFDDNFTKARSSIKTAEPTIPTAYPKGFNGDEAGSFGPTGRVKTQTVVTANLAARPVMNNASIKDDIDENSSILAPHSAYLQNIRGYAADSKLLKYQQQQQSENSREISHIRGSQLSHLPQDQTAQDQPSTNERVFSTDDRPETPNSCPKFIKVENKTNEYSQGTAEHTKRNLSQIIKHGNASNKDIDQEDADAHTLSAQKLDQTDNQAMQRVQTLQGGTFDAQRACQKQPLIKEDNQAESISVKEANLELHRFTEQFNANEQDLRNSKIVFQTKKGEKSIQPSVQMTEEGSQAVLLKSATLVKNNTNQDAITNQIVNLKRKNESSATVHQIMQQEKHLEQDGIAFEHRSYGTGNVVTHRNEEQNQLILQDKLSKPITPYMAESKLRMLGGLSSPGGASDNMQAIKIPNFQPNLSVTKRHNDEIGSVDLQQSKIQQRQLDLNNQQHRSQLSLDSAASAANLMADSRFTNQGLIIQRMKLQDISAKKRCEYLAQKALQEASKNKGGNKVQVVETEQQVSPGLAAKGIADSSPSKFDKTGESYTASPAIDDMLRDAKNIQMTSPVQITSEDRSKEDQLFKMKSKINSTMERESNADKARIQSQVTNFMSPGTNATKRQITSNVNSPKQPSDISVNAINKSKVSKANGKAKSPTLVKKQNQNADLPISNRLTNELILVSADVGKQSKLDERIESQAKAALEKKIKQPLHEAPPKYLQRSTMGTKYQFQIPAKKRRSSLQFYSKFENDTAINSMYSFGPQGNEDKETNAENEKGERQATTAPISRFMNSQHASFIDEQTKLGNANVNIRNLYQQSKRARTQGADGSMLRPIGVVDEELVLLREAVPELLLIRHEKTQEFYQQQVNNVNCQKAKRLVGKQIDPNVKLDKSHLDPHGQSHMSSAQCDQQFDWKRQSFRDSRMGKSSGRDPLDQTQNSDCRNQNQRYPGDFDRGGQAGRVQVTQTRLLRSSLGFVQGSSTCQQQDLSQFAVCQPPKKKRVGSIIRKGNTNLDGDRIGQMEHSKTGSIDSNLSSQPPNQINYTAVNRHDVPVLEPTLNDMDKSATAILSIHELGVTQRNQSPAYRAEESSILDFDQIMGQTQNHQSGQLHLSCQVTGSQGPKQKHKEPATPQSLVSPPGIVNVKSKVKRPPKNQNKDLNAVNEEQQHRVAKNFKATVADHTINITLDDSANEHHKKGTPPIGQEGMKNTYDFKKGVHRDFRGLVDQNKKTQAAQGTIGSLSPQSQNIRKLQANRLLGKQKEHVQVAKHPATYENIKPQEVQVLNSVQRELSATPDAPQEMNQSTRRRESQNSLQNFGMNDQKIAPFEQDASQAQRIENDMKQSSIQYSGKEIGVNDSALANRFPDQRGYSSMEDDIERKQNETLQVKRRKSLGHEDKSKKSKKNRPYKVDKRGASSSFQTDRQYSSQKRNDLVESHFNPNRKFNLNELIPSHMYPTEILSKPPELDLPKSDPQITETLKSGNRIPEGSQDLAGQVDERKLRELLGNRDLFNLPTTDIEDLLKEVRERANADVRDFGLLGYKADIKPIEQLLKSQRSQDRSIVESKYGQKKQIQPFFKENRAEYMENVKARCNELSQRKPQCSKLQNYYNKKQQVATGIVSSSHDQNPIIDLKNPPVIHPSQEQAQIMVNQPYQELGEANQNTATRQQDQNNQAEVHTTQFSQVSSPQSNSEQTRIFTLQHPLKFTTEPLQQNKCQDQ